MEGALNPKPFKSLRRIRHHVIRVEMYSGSVIGLLRGDTTSLDYSSYSPRDYAFSYSKLGRLIAGTTT